MVGLNFGLYLEPSKAEHLYDGDSWMLAEHIPDIDFYFCQIWLHSFTNEMEHSLGHNYDKVISFHRGYVQHWFYGEKDCHRFCLDILEKLKADPGFGEKINENIIKYSDALVADGRKINQTNLKKLSGKQLWELYWKNIELHLELYRWGWLPNAVDMFYPELTTYLKNLLRGYVENETKLNEAFVKLTAADEETIATREHRGLLKLAIAVSQAESAAGLFTRSNKEITAGISPGLLAKFQVHCDNFRHLKFMYHGQAADNGFYFDQVRDYLQSGKNPTEELEEIDATLANAAAEKKKLIGELKIDSRLQRLLAIYAKFMVTKWYRRNSQILCFYYIEPLLREIGVRLNLSLEGVRLLLWEEVRAALVDNIQPDANNLAERETFFCLYTEKGKRFLFTGELAKKLEQQATKVKLDTSMKELKGQCACLGKARGKVKVIFTVADAHKMKEGDILVSVATDPDLVPAMKKAAAIITEQGGVTSHAAIVSRELNIPCIIGTKVATKWLKDGDEVEVDATNGIVRKV